MDGIRRDLRSLPSVDRLLQHPAVAELSKRYSYPLVVEAAREALERVRERIRAGGPPGSEEEFVESIRLLLCEMVQPSLKHIINATGVIIHTNLGRAPLSDSARQAMAEYAAGYTNLEYDLEQGRRGSRYTHAEALLCQLTGAEAALVVNNNAGAVLLTLTSLATGREVIISRSQLIEIGGGFRIPEVMAESGARLVEVGTTNRTRISDFRKAITDQTGLLMRAHHSNFRIIGFTEEPQLAELAELGRQHRLPLLDDLGSGSLLNTSNFGLEHEPTIQESLAAGASLVTFSGDKLLGGPQAGILVGRRDLVDQLHFHPLTRALRVDKVTLAGLQATLLHYRKGEAVRDVPVWRMIALHRDAIAAIAQQWTDELMAADIPASVQAGESTIGGGSLPGATLPTWHVAVRVDAPDDLAKALRKSTPAVVGIIQAERWLIDPRTVMPGEGRSLLDTLRKAYRQVSSSDARIANARNEC